MSDRAIKAKVKEVYTGVAQGSSGCDCGCGTGHLEQIGYSREELGALPDEAVAGAAGCGNPTAIAQLEPGQVVLDLGSGAGIDVFLAAGKVGPSGRVIGVDMTEAMVEKARAGAAKLSLANVEFRLGEIERLPVEDGSIDVIISNCVINLSPNKDAVFQEAYRVLRPGGKMIFSDLVTRGELPQEVRENLAAWAGCVAGTLDQQQYEQKMLNAGFREVQPLREAGPLGGHSIYSVVFKAVKAATH